MSFKVRGVTLYQPTSQDWREQWAKLRSSWGHAPWAMTACLLGKGHFCYSIWQKTNAAGATSLITISCEFFRQSHSWESVFVKRGQGPWRYWPSGSARQSRGKLDNAGVHSTNRVGGKTRFGIGKPSSAFTGGVTSGESPCPSGNQFPFSTKRFNMKNLNFNLESIE